MLFQDELEAQITAIAFIHSVVDDQRWDVPDPYAVVIYGDVRMTRASAREPALMAVHVRAR